MHFVEDFLNAELNPYMGQRIFKEKINLKRRVGTPSYCVTWMFHLPYCHEDFIAIMLDTFHKQTKLQANCTSQVPKKEWVGLKWSNLKR